MGDVVIVGAGQAAASCAAKLRSLGHDGKITIFGAEPVPPYQRPPLSKAYLLGEMEEARLYLRPESFYSDQGIDLRVATKVDAIDLTDRCVIANGEVVAFDDLVLATGSVPRRLPAAIGGALDGVHVVRDLNDVDRMRPRFTEGARVLIVGGGYIGLEAAAVAAKLGLTVTLVEMSERILQRVASEETANYFRDLHRAHGVDLREGTGLERLTGEGHVRGAVLSDGSELEVDFVIVGVGITPATELAEAAGIVVENGIKTDAQCQTSAAHVWAAGDCASFPVGDARLRLESVPNAIDMGELVAENILGASKAYAPEVWFWSDQYDVKLQIAGLNTGFDRTVTRDSEDGYSVWYYKGERLLAVDAMNDARAFMVAKRLISMGKSPAPEVVGDPATELKGLLKG